ncbi:glycosyltransferase family 4 protein [Marinobacter salarius]|uniref:glycosyltransferase family 4 protein n=1 Tax=Marinobacter salarius TaxID=1420917 RepID=UPI0018F14603|nr:glycosyltransferase family 4 protein [Marinobacter salarius]MBJ7278466.1 glycosyltransferase family 4 protein [Marinobacter salarius]
MVGSELTAKKILFVVNAPEFLLSHRLPIALAAREAGYDVHVASADGDAVRDIRHLALAHHTVAIARSGQNPLAEVGSIISLYRLFRELKPDLVHLITIKPVLYGGIAARLAGEPAVVAAISGLGTIFVAQSVGARARRILVSGLYRLAFSQRRLAVIFQNPDDRDGLLSIGALRRDQVRMIRGSGANLANYAFVPEPQGTPVVVMAVRLLRDKGVYEFVEAARLLKARGVDVVMRLIGAPDSGNPTSVEKSEVDGWAAEGVVELPGYRTDIAHQYQSANIVCLPSYREGLPKGLVEAAACGRAVVTTDVPGCRDAIEPDVTGVLVPVKNAQALADAIQALIETPERRLRMGKAGRELAEKAFSINRIVEQHLAIYKELLGDG